MSRIESTGSHRWENDDCMTPAQSEPDCLPLSESSLLLRWGNTINAELNHRIVSFSRGLSREPVPGMAEAAPAYCSLIVTYDTSVALDSNRTSFDCMAQRLLDRWHAFHESDATAGRLIEIPVRYGGEDLNALARAKGLTESRVIELHAGREYRVYLMGFLPGFAYLGDVDDQIAAPRHASPRLRVEAGSVGIAGRQTGVYPIASPGGWQVIGRTNTKLFDPTAEQPILLSPGDRVRFLAI